jgi:hypothetical protein
MKMMLRTEPLAHLPALLALALAAMSLPAQSQTRLVSLCSGSSLPSPSAPSRDCDQACHIGCSRERKASVRI